MGRPSHLVFPSLWLSLLGNLGDVFQASAVPSRRVRTGPTHERSSCVPRVSQQSIRQALPGPCLLSMGKAALNKTMLVCSGTSESTNSSVVLPNKRLRTKGPHNMSGSCDLLQLAVPRARPLSPDSGSPVCTKLPRL